MVQITATATFEDKEVRIEVKDISSDPPRVLSTFGGRFNKSLKGTSEGLLEYHVLPEGKHRMDLSVIQGKLVIKFYSAVAPSVSDPQFEGALFGEPEADTGDGWWISANFHQQVFLLSLFSNVIRAEKGTDKNLEVSARLQINVAATILGWQVVWGPVVWKNDPNNISGPDHVWFVAKKLSHNNEHIYVISVAGSATIYNTVVNNGGIIPVVNFTTWRNGVSPTPSPTPTSVTGSYIALGTAVGVHTLESYPAPTGAEGAGQTLPHFLKNAPRGSGTQFIFTGFSLGGTLSPTLALRLVKADAGIFTETDNILTYPVAGASPGNIHFANAFAARFPKSAGSGYQVWNSNIANLLDVATNAWSTDDSQPLHLDRIRRIYNNAPIDSVDLKIDLAKATANKSGIVYIPLQSTLFTGPAPPFPPVNEEQFIGIAALQHSIAYENYFGIELPKGIRFPSSQKGEGASREDVFRDLVIGI